MPGDAHAAGDRDIPPLVFTRDVEYRERIYPFGFVKGIIYENILLDE